MTKRILSLVCLFTVLVLSTACGWMGETAGRAKAGVENAFTDTRDGYNKGYESGKKPDAKSGADKGNADRNTEEGKKPE